MVFRHPKYYKELRKRNKSDQAISSRVDVATSSAQRATGPGQSLTRDSNADGGEGSSPKLPDSTMVKQRASSSTSRDQEPQAASSKPQASSAKLGEK